MQLNRLMITAYRNLQAADLSFSPNVNCFVGANGMGKSNILDAIYYLSFCRGYASALDLHNLNHESDFFILEGAYTTDEGVGREVSISLKRGARKRLRIDSKDVKRISEHIGCIPLVMIAPADSSLIMGGSEERRRFMDMVIMQYDMTYLEALIRYERSLKQRNALLKADDEPDAAVLDVIEEMMTEDAEVIFNARQSFIESFRPIFHSLYATLSGVTNEQPDILYESHCQRGGLLPQLRGWRVKERIVGYTLHGVHKDELQLSLAAHPVKREASQGQQKTFYIAMKLSQYVFLATKGERRVPLLLLDDIFDKLDENRVARIIDYVSGQDFGQIFITDTGRDHLSRILSNTNSDYRLFEVKDGEVTRISE